MSASVLQSHIQKVKIPTLADKVYKDDCIFCFDTPESPNGLYICMSSFLGVCRKHIEGYSSRTSNCVFLHLKRIRKEVVKEAVPEKAPTKLAIGLEGGFDINAKKYEFEEHNSIVLLPDFNVIPLPCTDLPDSIQFSISCVLEADAASLREEAEAMAGTWDGMQRGVTKHAYTLKQLDNGVKIPPKDWQCQVCGLKQNLWLNLSDGAIHCGRYYFNGLGGNNHAVEHYEKTKFPLVVKLGTVTSECSDVYSYDEDAMVIDPNLPAHLAHFGINIRELTKTDKSMVELEIDMNQRIGEWATIQEAGTKLVPLYGPGYTGIANLGNSCYLNSIMQVIFNIPDFQKCYYDKCEEIFRNSTCEAPKDFTVQMAKLAYGLLSGDYSQSPEGKSSDSTEEVEELPGIKPMMFKNLIGQGHPEFSTKKQQDAQEFFLHLISILERNTRGRENPAESLKFEVEERMQCSISGKVKYTTRSDYLLSLPIPLEAATNKDELDAYEIKKAEVLSRGDRMKPEDIIRPRIPLLSCLESFTAAEPVNFYITTGAEQKTIAYKSTKLRTFPDFLVLHLKKFTIGDDWVPKKLDISIDVPDELDLSSLRGKGLQPDEEELPEMLPEFPDFEYNEALLYQLCDMGFPVDGCKRALYYSDNENIDVAMNWVMEHMNDADFNAPFDPPGVKKNNPDFKANPEAITTIVSMGFTPTQATKALEATNNDMGRAVDWIFSHSEEMETDSPVSESPTVKAQFRDGSERPKLVLIEPGVGRGVNLEIYCDLFSLCLFGIHPACVRVSGHHLHIIEYRLVAFISHMGPSTVAGHYVCHILKEGRWVIFNDNKVALSEHPPKDLAYMYLYQRV